MTQVDDAIGFKAMHEKGSPLVLYNIWDAGSAIAIEKAGAKAIATGSWSVAAAQGYADGEAMPLDFALSIVKRISHSTHLPLTVDFEGGYAVNPEQIEANVVRVIDAGAVGVNFEDQIIGGEGLYSIADQAARIAAVRKAADGANVPLFINARTDIFLKAKSNTAHSGLVDEALARQKAFADAGADGFFVPGLTDRGLIQTICEQSSLPVNVLVKGEFQLDATLAKLGVSRISFGPSSYIKAIEDLTTRFVVDCLEAMN